MFFWCEMHRCTIVELSGCMHVIVPLSNISALALHTQSKELWQPRLRETPIDMVMFSRDCASNGLKYLVD
jgi:hypothetical protein